jgi:hypothetical protein
MENVMEPELPEAGDPYWISDHPKHAEAVARVSQSFRSTQSSSAVAADPDRAIDGAPDDAPEPSPSDPRTPAPEPYELKPLPILKDARDFVADSGATAAEIGISQELAQDLLTAYAMDADFPEIPHYTGTPEAAEASLQKEWGHDYEHRLGLARWALRQSGARVIDALDRSGLGNNPAVVKFFARDGARAALDQIYAKRDHPLFDSSHREHKRALSQVRWLHEVAGR